jgi:preprotein translocase subunit SecY
MTILETLKNAWKVADIKKKILYTLFIIVLFRIGTSIPVPFIDSAAIASFFNPTTGATTGENLLGYLNMLSGNALAQGTVFALTIQPYINSSIIIQLLTIAIPYFEKLQKDGGDEGKKKLTQITRYTTVIIGLIQGFAYYTALKSSGALVTFGGFYPATAGVALPDGRVRDCPVAGINARLESALLVPPVFPATRSDDGECRRSCPHREWPNFGTQI